jgi:predicted permease
MLPGSVMQAFRLAGTPVIFLAMLCVGLGLAALTFDPGAAVALFVAGIGALVVFVLIADVIVPPRSLPATSQVRARPVDRRPRHR